MVRAVRHTGHSLWLQHREEGKGAEGDIDGMLSRYGLFQHPPAALGMAGRGCFSQRVSRH